MTDACQSTAFSIAKDGKYHDATFRVEGDVVSVIYWGRDGVTRTAAQARDLERPEQIACQLLSQIIDDQPQFT
jgi:hypothetical protein